MRVLAVMALLFVLAVPSACSEDLDYCGKGLAAQKAGNHDLAIDHFSRCINQGDLTVGQFASAHYNRGNSYYQKGNYNQAISDYTDAIRHNPSFARAYDNRGVVYLRMGNYDQAIQNYNEAIRLDPGNALTYNNRGSAYDNRGDHGGAIADYDRAIADFTQAIRLDTLEGPRKAWPFNNRGNTHRAKGQYDRAIADFDQAIRLNPDYAIAFNNRGLAYDGKGQHDRAIADYDEAIRLMPDYAIALNNLAGVLATAPNARLRDGPRAVRLAEKAVSLLDDAHTRDHLAAAYAEASRFRDAVNAQERAISKARAEGSSASDIADMEDRLRLYRQGRPYREKR